MKVNFDGLEEFRATLPEDIQHECFKWIAARYSIAKAFYLINKYPDKINKSNLSVRLWAESLGLGKGYDEKSFGGMIYVDDKKAISEKINYNNFPILMVTHTFGRGKKKESFNLIIDGNHRLRKAFLDGKETIPVIHLQDLSKFCLI